LLFSITTEVTLIDLEKVVLDEELEIKTFAVTLVFVFAITPWITFLDSNPLGTCKSIISLHATVNSIKQKNKYFKRLTIL
jgi:hypothetical protein